MAFLEINFKKKSKLNRIYSFNVTTIGVISFFPQSSALKIKTANKNTQVNLEFLFAAFIYP